MYNIQCLGEERLTLLQRSIVSFIPSTVEDAETMHDGASEECLVLSVFVAPPLASRVVRRCVLPHGLWAHSFHHMMIGIWWVRDAYE